MGTDIKQLLPSDIFRALMNANSPSGTNPFVTTSDILNMFTNVLYVEKVPILGQFATVEAALASITTNSSLNRFLIKVGVGDFPENQLNMKSYVSVIGSSIQETIIRPAGNHDLFVFTDVFSELSFMSLQGTPLGFSAVFCNDSGDYTQLHKVNFVDNDTNVKVVALTQNTVIYIEYCDVNGVMTYGTYQDGSSGFRAVVNTENWYTFPSTTGFTSSFLTGPDALLTINASGVYGSVIIGDPPVVGNFGIVFQDGARVVLNGVEIGSFDTAIQNNNTGVSCIVHGTGINLDNNNIDINIQHPNTSGGMLGAATLTKVFIDPISTFTPLFTEQSVTGGLVVVGNIYTGAKLAEVVEISTFIGSQSVGLIYGADLTDGGGFQVDVSAGIGYINDGTLRQLTWNNTNITLAADQTKFLYFDNLGVLLTANSKPDTIFNLYLGKIRTNATGIEFISETPFKILWSDNNSEDYQRNIFGALYQFGSIVSESATPFELDVQPGSYYYGNNKYTPSGGTAITFNRYYQDSVSTYAIEYTQTLVPNALINTGFALVAMTATFYAKHLLLIVGDGTNEKYFLVYAQSEYATLLAAETAPLPSIPTYFDENVTTIASIIVQQGAANIIQVLSERRLPTTQTSATAPVSSHLALTDLTTGNAGHTQFLLLDGSISMIGSLDMATNNIINIGTLNGVTIEAHASRHLPNGLDPLTTAAPTTNLGGASTNAVGIQNSFSRSDHSHAIDVSGIATTGLLTSADWNIFNNKQNTLVSGTNIKTLNGASLLGAGNITTTLAQVLAVGALTNSVPITSNNGKASLIINNTLATLQFVNGTDTSFFTTGPTYLNFGFAAAVNYLDVYHDKTGNNTNIQGNGTIQFSNFTDFRLPVSAGIGPNSLIYANGTSSIKNVTLSGGLTLTAGTLSLGAITGATSFNGLVVTANTGVITTGTWNAAVIDVTFGGTGTTTAFTIGSIVFAGASGVYTQNNANFFWDNTNTRLGIKTAAPTAFVDIGASTTAAAALRLRSGVAPTTPNLGDVWYDGTDVLVRTAARTDKVARTLTGSATLDFPNTAAFSFSDLTITVTGAAAGDVAVVGPAAASIPNNTLYFAWVSAANTVSIRFINNNLIASNPASGTFKVMVFKNI